MKEYHFKAYLLASAGTVLIAASASAETTSSVSGPTDQGQATSFSIDEIVVTAQRVKESLSKTPVAVSVISSEAMAAAQIVSEQDRAQPDALLEKLFVRTFQCAPHNELTTKFRDFIATRRLPLEDTAIRELLLLMMASPNYQVT